MPWVQRLLNALRRNDDRQDVTCRHLLIGIMSFGRINGTIFDLRAYDLGRSEVLGIQYLRMIVRRHEFHEDVPGKRIMTHERRGADIGRHIFHMRAYYVGRSEVLGIQY